MFHISVEYVVFLMLPVISRDSIKCPQVVGHKIEQHKIELEYETITHQNLNPRSYWNFYGKRRPLARWPQKTEFIPTLSADGKLNLSRRCLLFLVRITAKQISCAKNMMLKRRNS